MNIIKTYAAEKKIKIDTPTRGLIAPLLTPTLPQHPTGMSIPCQDLIDQ